MAKKLAKKSKAKNTKVAKAKHKPVSKAKQAAIAEARSRVTKDDASNEGRSRADLQAIVLPRWHLLKANRGGGGFFVYGRFDGRMLGPYRTSDGYDSLLVALANFPVEVGVFGLSSVTTCKADEDDLKDFTHLLKGDQLLEGDK